MEHHGDRSTYTYQLEAFADHVRNGSAIPTSSDDALVQAELIDACYQAAGLPLRPVTSI